MRALRPSVRRWYVVLIAVQAAACASVPKETVELSYVLGQDLEEIHTGYKLLIANHFDNLRGQVERAVNEVFLPAYVSDFVDSGNLLGSATDNRPDLVVAWAQIAVETIDSVRAERLAPVNQAEEALLASVDSAFAQAALANATITAHLNSLREVEEVQNNLLEALKLRDLRDRVNNGLVEASNQAAEITEQVNQAAANLDNLSGGNR